MDMEKDTWSIIDAYFRDTKDYLVKHHIDSYNDFINRKIPLIFKNSNKLTTYRTDYNDSNLIYKIDLYFGGKKSEGKNVYISKPTIVDHETGIKRQLYPNEARLKDLTYGADVFYDIDIDYSLYKKVDGELKPIYENVPAPEGEYLKNIYLGKIPIMLRSCLCVLNNTEPDTMYQMGESKYETGGYFIIDGSEKIIVSSERRAENKIFLFNTPMDNKYTHIAELKSSSLEDFQPARTIKLQMEKNGAITVRFGQDKPFFVPSPDGSRDVPLFIIFRMLGVETDKEILEYICHNLDTDLSKKMISMLYPSINDPLLKDEDVFDQDSASYFLENRVSRAVATGGSHSDIIKNVDKRMSYLYMTLYENCFPHVGRDFRAKVHYLAYMTQELLRFKLGIEKETIRDNFINKRIDLSGFLMAASFRNAIDQLQRKIALNIKKNYEESHTEYSDDNFIYIVNERNFLTTFEHSRFQKHFIDAMKKGNIDLSLGSKSGSVQTMERKSYLSDLSHLRRINDPVPPDAKVSVDRRRLHGSQYGCVCPTETPEGGNVGLRKALSMMSDVSFGCSPIELIKLIKNMGLVQIGDIHPREMYGKTKVFVNGVWIGIHLSPEKLYTHLLLYRRNGLLNVYTSIAWYKEKDEIICCTDQGRFCRPLYIVENNRINIEPSIIEKTKKGELKWGNLLSGFNKRKSEFSYFDCNTYNIEQLELNLDIDERKASKEDIDAEIIKELHKKQAVIEYLDGEELNTRMLSPKFDVMRNHDSELTKYTHCELHPSLMFGTSAFYLAFIQNNPAQRASMGIAQSKQSIGTYITNFNHRIDTTAHLLHYPERPLAITRMNKHMHGDKISMGQNIVVAITAYNGYNQEDGIIANKMSLDMGMFNTTLFKMYKDFEKTDDKSSSKERFYNPLEDSSYDDEDELDIENIMNRGKNYGKLDKYGFIKEGEVIEENDVIFGKYIKIRNEQGIDEYSDVSKVALKDHYGSIVDKVFTTVTNISGDRLVKVRIAQYRRPEHGDKFASRYAQKGTFGLILKPEDMPYSENGIIPDMLLNPYGYPSRMTVAQFMEIICGRLATEMGYFGLASPFEPINPNSIMDALERMGLSKTCDEIFYDGMEGRMMDCEIFTGPIYYQRLKHMVHEKINSRSPGHKQDGIAEPGGKYDSMTRQVVGGRALEGGLRVGEMERDALLSHGIHSFFRESMMDRGDKFPIYVSKKTGHISIVNPKGAFGDNIYFNPTKDGPLDYYLTETIDDNQFATKTDILGLNTTNATDSEFVRLEVPYAFKLLLQEMEGMSIVARLKVADNKILLDDDIPIWNLDENDSDSDYSEQEEEQEQEGGGEEQEGGGDEQEEQEGGGDEQEGGEEGNGGEEGGEEEGEEGGEEEGEEGGYQEGGEYNTNEVIEVMPQRQDDDFPKMIVSPLNQNGGELQESEHFLGMRKVNFDNNETQKSEHFGNQQIVSPNISILKGGYQPEVMSSDNFEKQATIQPGSDPNIKIIRISSEGGGNRDYVSAPIPSFNENYNITEGGGNEYEGSRYEGGRDDGDMFDIDGGGEDESSYLEVEDGTVNGGKMNEIRIE